MILYILLLIILLLLYLHHMDYEVLTDDFRLVVYMQHFHIPHYYRRYRIYNLVYVDELLLIYELLQLYYIPMFEMENPNCYQRMFERLN